MASSKRALAVYDVLQAFVCMPWNCFARSITFQFERITLRMVDRKGFIIECILKQFQGSLRQFEANVTHPKYKDVSTANL